MAFKMPELGHLTYSDLLDRWKCTDNQLRNAIISGDLVPAIFVDGHCALVDWQYDSFEGYVPEDAATDGQGEEIRLRVVGPLFLQRPKTLGPWDCEFRVASNVARPEIPDSPGWMQIHNWYWTPDPLTLDDVSRESVFLMSEVRAFEARHSAIGEPVTPEPDAPITTRERNTLLTIIAALCTEAKVDYTKASKSGELIAGMVKAMGADIGPTTIRDHLKKIPDALASRMK